MKDFLVHAPLYVWIPVVVFIDYLTPLGVADGMLYLPALVYTITFRDKKCTLLYAAICSAAVVLGIFLSPDEGVRWTIFMLNRVYCVFVIWLIAFFVIRRISQKETIEKLGHMITMSAWNKQVKYRGDWISIEEYLKKEFDIIVSHGIDPESADKVMREIEGLKKKKS